MNEVTLKTRLPDRLPVPDSAPDRSLQPHAEPPPGYTGRAGHIGTRFRGLLQPCRDGDVLYLGSDPLAAPIRSRPDYTALLRRIQHPTAG